MRVEASPDPVFLEPRAVPRPLAQQRLVRELDLPIADGQKASIRQLRKNGSRAGDALELAEGHPAARQRSILAAGEPQHHRPRDPPLTLAELVVGVLGQPRDRAAYATDGLVAGVAQHPAVASPPYFQQRGREQRQPPGLPDHIGHQRVNQSRLPLEPGASGRLLDRPRHLGAIHRPDQHMATAHQPRETRIGSQAAIEIRAQRHDHQRTPLRVTRRRHQLLQEPGLLVLLLTQGE